MRNARRFNFTEGSDTFGVPDAQKAQETQGTLMLENGDRFWQGVLRFRETIEKEGIEFTDAAISFGHLLE